MKIMFACDECGIDHIIDSDTKEIELWNAKEMGYSYFQYVQYEDDPLPKEVVKSFDGFKWKCLKCGCEGEEKIYTRTEYYL